MHRFLTRKDLRYYELVDSNLNALYPNSEAIIDLNRKVTELRDLLKLEIGSLAPDMALPDSGGNTIPLSSLRGKNVLVVFWATWSSNSVAELQKFALLYTKSANNNLEFYQVSLDRTRVHVSDLKYWDSPVVPMYRLEQLPVAYLLNKEGVIMRRNFTADDFPAILSGISD
jgi:thiol-disulfide isomerase/thioredoxin